MSLNIKNEEVHALVREAARRSGLSQTAVVEAALRDYLERADKDGRATDVRRRAELDTVVSELQQLVREHDGLGIEPEDLYDPVTGLPA